MTAASCHSRRLLLRRFTPADGPGLLRYLSRPEVVEFEPYGPLAAAEADEWAAVRAVDPAFWAVCLLDGTLIGNLYVARVAPEAWRTWELGYVLDSDHWGQGYATEAAARLLDAAFGEWDAHRVLAQCDPRNTASWRLLERLGFRREGHLLASATFGNDAAGDPVWKDTYLYAILECEWLDHPVPAVDGVVDLNWLSR